MFQLLLQTKRYPDNVTVEVVKWFGNAWCTQQGTHLPEPIEEVGILQFSEVIGNIYDNPEFLGAGGIHMQGGFPGSGMASAGSASKKMGG